MITMDMLGKVRRTGFSAELCGRFQYSVWSRECVLRLQSENFSCRHST